VNYRIIPTPRFQKDVKYLKKKYRHIASDLEEFNNILGANPFYGEEITGLEGKVLKARLASSDMRKGKGKGYRVIYYLSQEENIIYLLTIYAKAYKENISVAEIKEIISRYGL
jgi:mRNA-degrading endonuclease RelE of RelBE toxin-antitoxin system